MKATEFASGWKAMELTLADEDGKMTVQARSDPDRMNVSVRFSEARLRAQMTANARQLRDTMQAQYGSDVDLSFAGGNSDESGRQASDGSVPERRSSPASSDELTDETTSDDTAHRRRSDGRREWIG